jgi:hypothetical protein
MADKNSRWSFSRLRLWISAHLVLVLISLTLCGLVLFPLADCIDCDLTGSWGRIVASYEVRSAVFACWLLGASFLVGVLRRRWGWLVPVAIVLIACVTEPLGGVELSSLFSNEGRVMLLYGGFFGMTSFLVGTLLRVYIDLVVKPRSTSRTVGPPGA